MNTTKLFLAFIVTVLLASFGGSHARADVVAQTEVYGTASDGTVLHWDVYAPTTPGPWPAVLVIHGGGFTMGSPTSAAESVECAQDLASSGVIAFSIEYRLAPPGSLPGQVSDGRYPQQEDDVKLAARTARADPRCNGQLGAIGGSAGGYHTAYLAATGTVGDDRIDFGVCLSGLMDGSDFSPNPGLDAYTALVTNYVGVPATDTTALRAASPAWLADANTAPLFLINSIRDPMPYSQIPDMIAHLDALGLATYQALTIPGNDHSWAYYPTVKDQVLAFIADRIAGVPSPPPVPTPGPADLSKKLLNVSTRANVSNGDNVMVGGFIVTGVNDKRVVMRGLGPSLSSSGLTGLLPDPVLDFYDSAGNLIESNDNRLALPGVPNPLLPVNPSESLLTAILPPGNYTAVLHDANGAMGIGLVELYDTDPVDSRVSNISTRGQVGAGDDQMIGGFIVGGADPTSVIVRALGPSLAAEGIKSPLPDPVLELRDGNGILIASDDNWQDTQKQQIIDTTIPPTNPLESAIVATLQPGNYTALVHDSKFRTGIALVEAYDLEPQ